MAAFDINK